LISVGTENKVDFVRFELIGDEIVPEGRTADRTVLDR
jgi:hypothetical protein